MLTFRKRVNDRVFLLVQAKRHDNLEKNHAALFDFILKELDFKKLIAVSCLDLNYMFKINPYDLNYNRAVHEIKSQLKIGIF